VTQQPALWRSSPGVVALSPTLDNLYLAYPGHAGTGVVHIFDAEQLQEVGTVQAHKTPVTCMAFNFAGTRLATASDKVRQEPRRPFVPGDDGTHSVGHGLHSLLGARQGTVIRVFGIPDRALLFQFRRGTKPATITSLAFNSTLDLLCVSSESETVHIFRMENRTAAYGPLQCHSGKKRRCANMKTREEWMDAGVVGGGGAPSCRVC